MPIYVSSSPTTIVLDLNPIVDNEGSPITAYILEMLDEEATTPVFTSTANFTTAQTTVTLTSTANGLIDGHIYRFRWYA